MDSIIRILHIIYLKIKLKILEYNKYNYSLWEKITTSRILISFLVGFLGLSIIFIISFKFYDLDFFKHMLSEIHVVLIEIIIISNLIIWLTKKGDKILANQRYQEEIDDLRGWESDFAARKISGNVKRLNKNGVNKIDLSNCYLVSQDLTNANLREANFKNAKLQLIKLQNADLRESHLELAELNSAILVDAKLDGAKLWEAELQGAQLMWAKLRRAELNKANFKGADLHHADLQEADLEGAENLTVDQLSKVQTLYKADLDTSLRVLIEKDYPHLLKKYRSP